MTTICTDRELPKVLNDYGGKGKGMFEKIMNWSIRKKLFPFLHNSAAYSKLGMSPLWKEILYHIKSVVSNGKDNNNNKLHLIAGHDTTIIPLMASLGQKLWNETDWPEYASMMIIEI